MPEYHDDAIKLWPVQLLGFLPKAFEPNYFPQSLDILGSFNYSLP